ncbi:FBD-like protein [Artemisia annua]|uniref:FBD-like protein n=1 Tax=Artemisia annua TaxID=35608 RepID=A0A2U1Q5K4_ARTAN|nr:FBD-like protein [Artemisia annua]
MSFTSENLDRLTSLPEDILSQILSLMPTKFAVRTSILSKRWRYTWTLIRNLDFDDSIPIYRLCLFVYRVLVRCETTQLDTFRLNFSKYLIPWRTLSKWIREAIRLNVCELDIQVKNPKLPLSIFTCKTLTKLRLHLNHSYSFNWDGSCNLPCLKTLDIVVHSKFSIEYAFKVIHGCPSLETLSLILYRGDLKVYNFKIPSLKRLKLKFFQSSVNKVVLNVSSLEYLFLGGNLFSFFFMENLSSLVEAKVSCEIRYIHFLSDFLKGISGVKSLYLTFKYQYWRDNPVVYLPKFPNLKYLELKGHAGTALNLIHKFLESSSELEHLYIEKLDGRHWNEPESVPTCMLMNLKTIEYDLIKASKCNIHFLKFMLGNSKVLKKLTVTNRAMKSLKGNERFCARLSGLPKASRDCQLHFI